MYGFGYGLTISRRSNAPFVGPLDAFAGQLYSVIGPHRALAAYTGPCWRVRRSIDNAEVDIGFDALGWVNKAALVVAADGGGLALVCDYDKTGQGRDWVPASTLTQPRVALAGVVDVGPNGNPCPVWDGINDAALSQNMLAFMREADDLTIGTITQTAITSQQILTQAIMPASPSPIQIIQYYLTGSTLRTQARLNPASGVNTNADVSITAGSWVRGISRCRYVDGFVETAANGTTSSVSASTAGRTPATDMAVAIPLGSNQAASSFFNGRIAQSVWAKALIPVASLDAALAQMIP